MEGKCTSWMYACSSGLGCWKMAASSWSRRRHTHIHGGIIVARENLYSESLTFRIPRQLPAIESVVWGVIQRGNAVPSSSLTCLLHLDIISLSRGSYLLFLRRPLSSPLLWDSVISGSKYWFSNCFKGWILASSLLQGLGWGTSVLEVQPGPWITHVRRDEGKGRM